MSEGRTKLLRMETWKMIRFDFSEEEKAKLNAAIVGETICPQGCVLDLVKLGTELETKLNSYERYSSCLRRSTEEKGGLSS